ncbi:creatininase family protein [Maribacter dokdonensis]|uniref:creatininase family protein n=2 Tax=Maribacter dokdonensis TaxID=320912 RepID=UPI0032968683
MDDANWGHFDRMLPLQIEAIFKKNPIAYIPWGAIEYHGNHNPTGLDTHKAYHLCTDLAKVSGGLVFPPISLAANLIKSYKGVDFPKHSIEFSERLVRSICEEYLEQLISQEFKIVVLLSGHAGQPHLDILKDVAERYNKKQTDCYIWALAEFDILPNELLEANHSALGETSLQLYYEPQTVVLDNLPKEREVTLKQDAVSGKDPRLANKKLGEQIAKTFVLNASKKIESFKQTYF